MNDVYIAIGVKYTRPGCRTELSCMTYFNETRFQHKAISVYEWPMY